MFLSGTAVPGLAGLVAWAAMRTCDVKAVPANIKKWLATLENLPAVAAMRCNMHATATTEKLTWPSALSPSSTRAPAL